MKKKELLRKKEELRKALFQAKLEERLMGKSENEISKVRAEYKENLLLLNS